MSINTLLRTIKTIAAQIKTVRSAYDGDVYTIWNTGEIKYASFVVSVASAQRQDNMKAYNLVLYYGDRLIQNNSNRNAIFDDATNTLQSVINKLTSTDEIQCEDYTIRYFEQKFGDDLAGAYVELVLYTEDELGECSINDVTLADEELIEKLKEAIRELEAQNAELALLLKEILYKISGETV